MHGSSPCGPGLQRLRELVELEVWMKTLDPAWTVRRHVATPLISSGNSGSIGGCDSRCRLTQHDIESMAGTTGLEPATSAVTGQRSDQLSYVPKIVFNNLATCHIESNVSQLSLFSLHSTFSSLWTQFRAFLDTKWTPNWTPNPPLRRRKQVYQKEAILVSTVPVTGQGN